MNKTETKAYEWLQKLYKLKPSEIVYCIGKSPDFILNDGRTFEVKRLYSNSIVLYENQIKNFKPNTVILVWGTQDSPYKIMVWKDVENKTEYEGIKIRRVSEDDPDNNISVTVRLPAEINKELMYYMADSNINSKPEAVLQILEDKFDEPNKNKGKIIESTSKADEVLKK